jgi:YidC/Oxa1 family membrane protein insertase
VPEIYSPDLRPQGSRGNGALRSFLVFIALFFTLLFGYRYAHGSAISAPVNGVGRSIASPDFGWLTIIARPLYVALRFLHGHGVGNWGWAIIAFTVMFNLVTVWPRMMSMKSSLKMMRIQPGVDAIKKRYAHLTIGDPKRAEMNGEMMALYKAEGANMFGGCLPLVVQMPLLFAYVSVLRHAPELQRAHWLWLTDLSSPDPLHILPVLIIASMMLTQVMTPAPTMTSLQRGMIGILMAAVMGFSRWHYAPGLSLYWITGNLVSLLIQLAINQSKMGREMNALAVERAAASRCNH